MKTLPVITFVLLVFQTAYPEGAVTMKGMRTLEPFDCKRVSLVNRNPDSRERFINISGLAMSKGMVESKEGEKKKGDLLYVAFGASVTASKPNHGVPQDKTYWALAAKRLEQATGRKVIAVNAGVGGNTTRDALKRIQKDVLDRKPELVTIQFGVNDGGHANPVVDSVPRVPPKEYRENLLKIVKLIRSIGARPILTTLQPLGSRHGKANSPFAKKFGLNYENFRYSDIIREVAKETGTPLADFQKVFLSRPDYDSLLPDGAHPNQEGHRMMGEVLGKVMVEMYSKQEAGITDHHLEP